MSRGNSHNAFSVSNRLDRINGRVSSTAEEYSHLHRQLRHARTVADRKYAGVAAEPWEIQAKKTIDEITDQLPKELEVAALMEISSKHGNELRSMRQSLETMHEGSSKAFGRFERLQTLYPQINILLKLLRS